MPDVRRGEPFGPEVAPSFVQSPLQLPLFLDQQKKAGLLFFPLSSSVGILHCRMTHAGPHLLFSCCWPGLTYGVCLLRCLWCNDIRRLKRVLAEASPPLLRREIKIASDRLPNLFFSPLAFFLFSKISSSHFTTIIFLFLLFLSRLLRCKFKKGTKNALETGRTFATLLADMDLRQRLLEARTEDEFKRILLKHTQELAEEQAVSIRVDHGSQTRLSTGGESNVRSTVL